jgi:hypothetical protein
MLGSTIRPAFPNRGIGDTAKEGESGIFVQLSDYISAQHSQMVVNLHF